MHERPGGGGARSHTDPAIGLAGHMQKDLVEQRKWVTDQDYVEGLAFAQLSPGPLAAQLAMLDHSLFWILRLASKNSDPVCTTMKATCGGSQALV